MKPAELAARIGGTVAVLLFIGFGLETLESIPDRANILVLPVERRWLPNTPAVHKKLAEMADSNDRKAVAAATVWTFEMIETTHRDIRTGKPYAGFEPLDLFSKRDPKWLNVGRECSLIGSFYAKSRWNADGSWNW